MFKIRTRNDMIAYQVFWTVIGLSIFYSPTIYEIFFRAGVERRRREREKLSQIASTESN